MDSPDTRPMPGPSRSTALQLREEYMLQTGLARPSGDDMEDDGLDLRVLLATLRRHKWVILASAVIGLVIATINGLTQTPMYRATVTVQIDQTAPSIVPFIREGETAPADYDGMNLKTQVELLRSRALAERVIDELGLDPSRGRVTGEGGPPAPALGGAMEASAASASAAEAAASKPQASGGWFGAARDLYERTLAGYRNLGKPAQRDRAVLSREAVVGGFMGSVQVAQVPNTRLVRVTVTSAKPDHAARVANALVRTFIAMSLERRNESSGYAETFLQDQIKATKAKLEESERALNAYARANAILMLDDKTNVLNQTFSDTSAALAQAQRDRQKAEAIYNEVQRNPESAQQVLESKTIQTYKEQKAKLEAEYLTNLSLFKPEFPKMQQLKAQIAEIDARIKAEIQVVQTAVKAQFEAAKKQEEQLRSVAGQTKQEVLVSQDKAVQLNLLRREVETNRELYNGLLQRLKEVGVTSKVTANPISVVDAATPPLFPFEPNIQRLASLGLFGGLVIGLAWAFLRDYMDDSVKRTEQIEQEFGLPLLGLIPQVSRKDLAKVDSPWRLIVEDPRGMLAEAYRSMRTALQFSTAEGAPRQILITSTSEGEGKSTTALALAINFAQLGKRVLLIDADMRNPSLHKSLGVPNDRGLSNYLAGEGARDQLVHDTEVPGLSLLTAGPTPPSPADLLMGPRFLRLLEKSAEMGYDQLIVDGPPVLGIADAIVLGNQIPNVIFVVRAGRTRKSNIRNALRRMRLAGVMPLGVALTRLTAEHGHGGAYGGYGYGYGYGYGNASQGAGSAQRLNTARED